MIDFILTNWKLIAVLLLLVLNLFITILKRPKVLSTIVEVINGIVPNAINEAEKIYGSGNGSLKFDYAVNFVVDYICYRFNIDKKAASKYSAIVKAEIEKVLSTPQKKGD